jgi:hypothetical protein
MSPDAPSLGSPLGPMRSLASPSDVLVQNQFPPLPPGAVEPTWAPGNTVLPGVWGGATNPPRATSRAASPSTGKDRALSTRGISSFITHSPPSSPYASIWLYSRMIPSLLISCIPPLNYINTNHN